MSRFKRRSASFTAATVSAALVGVGLLAVQAPARASTVSKRPKVQVETALPYTVVQPASQLVSGGPAAARRDHRALPAAGTAEVSVQPGATRRAGSLPVLLTGRAPASYRVEVGSAAAAAKAGVRGVLVGVSATDPASAVTPGTRVSIDYSTFANAGGANFGSRLRLVALPGCALTTPDLAACRQQTPLASTNDAAAQTVSAVLPATQTTPKTTTSQPTTSKTTTSSSMVTAGQFAVAATAGTTGSNDDFTATSLAPSGSWSLSGASGSFGWSYPIQLPPAAAGGDVAPGVSLAYNSGSVDGRIAATNNQDSWIGQGWEYSPGFIERTYRSCSDDTSLAQADQTGDECWAGQILTYSLGGAENAIVQDDTDHSFHLKNDDGSRVELIGAGSAGYQNEYWKVTAPTGVQYFFGRDTLPGGDTTDATWTVPVCGDANTACTGDGSGTISPIETQAWRWNLDYVVDPHGNATAYHYTSETNYYGQDGKTTPKVYDRGGYLNRIDYGMVESNGALSTAADRVSFTVAERCLSTCGTFDDANAANWPDTPEDLNCASSGTCDVHSPTFWSRKRLTTITTSYNAAGTFKNVDVYALGQSFPATGDPELELDSVTRTGYDSSGTSLALPKVSFTYGLLDNRVAGYQSQPAMQMWRLNQIATETGEKILIYYDQAGRAPAQCTSTTVPSDPSQDTQECYPVYWTPVGYTSPILDWFHKHLVTEVDVDDANAIGVDRYTTYSYLGTPGWHYDDNEVVRPKNRTYGQFRGYGKVEVRSGNQNHASNGVADSWTLSRTTYYRGMDGDPLPGGGSRSVTVSDTFGGTVTDSDQYADFPREQQVFNYAGGAEISATVTTPKTVATTATRARTGMPDLVARSVRTGTTTSYTDLAAGGTRQSSTSYGYDSFGRAISETDSGTGTATRCITTHYADNTGSWIRALVSEVITAAPACAETDGTGVLKDVRTYYDGGALGAVPGPGDATEVDTETTAGHWAVNKAGYDSLGRVTSTTVVATGSDSRISHTAYTPAGAGPLTSKVITNPLGQQETTTVDPGRGTVLRTVDIAGRITDASYDPTGRLTSVWRPGQVKGTDPASTTYAYTYGPTAPLAVTTKNLIDPGGAATPGYVTHVDIYDAFGQLRQTQDAAEGGGRNITDTITDSHGWVVLSNTHWHTTGTPGTALITTAQSGIEDSVQTKYDGAGRAVLATEYNGTTAKWATRTVYSGDSTTTVPPKGGIETTSRTDTRGNVTELDQWTTAPTINADNTVTGGSAHKTTYGYDGMDRRTAVTTAAQDPALSASWTTHYDLAGRVVEQDDPDSGATHDSYDDANEQVSSTDADGRVQSYDYDKLGRKIAAYAGSVKTASWSFDTVQAGQLSSTTSYTADGDYTEKTTAYDAVTGDPLSTEVDLPAGDVTAGFAASYVTHKTWTKTHLPASLTPAPGGNLPAETITTSYDSFGNPTGTTGYTAYVSATSYSPYGEPNQYTLGVNNQSAWLTYTRDAMTRRVTALNLSAQTAVPQLENVAYSYDAAGNITRAADTQGGGTGAPVETNCYDYSALQELTTAWSATDNCAADVASTNSTSTIGGPQPYWLTWTIDAAGGQLSKVAHAVPGGVTSAVTTSYTNGVTASTNLTAHSHALAASTTTTGTSQTGSSSYLYDADGNATSRTVNGSTQTVGYLPDGRVGSVGTAAGSVSYDYDADGNQLVRRDPGTITLFLSGEELTLTTATKAITGTRYYSHNGTLVALRVGHGNPSYEFSDLRGTATTVVPTTQTGTATPIRRHFDPYGAALPGGAGSPSNWPDKHQFLNKPTDQTTGLDELGARLYDSVTNRFLALDPVFDPNNPAQDNGYAYSDNNPVGLSDPTGLDPDPNVNHSSLHESAVQTDAEAIQAYVQTIGGDISAVTTGRSDNEIPGAAKNGKGGPGYPDIVYHDTTSYSGADDYYVWEVKGTRTSSPAAAARQGRQAVSEVKNYVSALQAQHPRSHVYPGFNLGTPVPFLFGEIPYISYDFAPASGALVYARDPDPGSRKPAPKPVPVTEPKPVPVTAPTPVMPTPIEAPRPPVPLTGPQQPLPTGAYPTPGPQMPVGGYTPSLGGGGWNIEVPQLQLTPQQQEQVAAVSAVGILMIGIMLLAF